MKKTFAGLSFGFLLISFAIAATLMSVRTPPMSPTPSIVPFMLKLLVIVPFAGIIFGVWGMIHSKRVNKSTTGMIVAGIGVLLNLAFSILFWLPLLGAPFITSGMVTDKYTDSSKGVSVICIKPMDAPDDWAIDVWLWDNDSSVKLYEQYGSLFWQKQTVSADKIQLGQAVRLINYPWEQQVIILKGQYRSYHSVPRGYFLVYCSNVVGFF